MLLSRLVGAQSKHGQLCETCLFAPLQLGVSCGSNPRASRTVSATASAIITAFTCTLFSPRPDCANVKDEWCIQRAARAATVTSACSIHEGRVLVTLDAIPSMNVPEYVHEWTRPFHSYEQLLAAQMLAIYVHVQHL
eukprot:CAMPEP_0119337892 /NCGR_PEP_ID=MMETSP1333-20130426/94941_1 /TAXON_ID=418940 /ORGANISM="Scyphosphaera apsteinii, Strain RCC1455" /LENGTH=136 /DNA_ID=CAMNT_0007349051 /DNA_START=183 /DNA_END=593 /DNA_ORIENTATION=-